MEKVYLVHNSHRALRLGFTAIAPVFASDIQVEVKITPMKSITYHNEN